MLRRLITPLVGLGMAVAGADKLAGDRAYLRLFKSWGWSRQEMRASGAVELAGGLLMANPGTRRLGGAIMVGSSAALLAAELRHRDDAMAVARIGVLATALIAFLGSSRH